ncbi:hypothetical protein BD414DRAFT_534920 [Trametes punicea]|nr:hypothetical protein BD414DRAFT_534920 [Trametes punicea]
MDNDVFQSLPLANLATKRPAHPLLTKQGRAGLQGQGSVASSDGVNLVHLNHHLGHPLFSSLGSGSGSSSQLPQSSSGQGTPASSQQSKTQSPDPLDTLPKVVESLVALPEPIVLEPVSIPPASISLRDDESQVGHQERPQLSANSSSASSDSEGHVGPTRASIRAWAKATPAGPPRDTPSPYSSVLQPSGIEDHDSRVSPTRSAGHLSETSKSSSDNVSSGSGDESARNAIEAEESSGNIADVESSGSEPVSASPLYPSHLPTPGDGSELTAHRQLLAPHPNTRQRVHAPHPRLHMHAHPHVQHAPRPHVPHLHTSSESSPPAPTPAQTQEHQERLDRRSQRHPQTGRRRHRDRDRDRDRRSRTPSSNAGVTQVAPGTVLAPLRPLPPPPPPLPRLRPLREASADSPDVLDEIVKMLSTSRGPLLRMGLSGDEGGWVPLRPPRQNDVLDDIYTMIVWSRGR